jgi:hypothetical protein
VAPALILAGKAAVRLDRFENSRQRLLPQAIGSMACAIRAIPNVEAPL